MRKAVGPIARRSEVIRQQRERGGWVAAVLPIHYPRALLRSFDLLPIEVWGPPGIDPDHGAAHVQAYVCSIVRNALSFILSGGLDVADVIMVPHTCDSLQGLGSLLLDLVRPRQPVVPFYLPRGERECDIQFLAEEFRAISRQLEEITGRSPSLLELIECVKRDEEADGLLGSLHHRRNELALNSYEFYRVLRAREYLPSEDFVELARSCLACAAEAPYVGVPVILSGIVPEPMSMLALIDELGARIVADDLACCGRRLYPNGVSEDPFVRMAERIVRSAPDPTRGSPLADRSEHLLRLAAGSEARAVVFHGVKFCEPELFDLPVLREELKRAGLPSVIIEVDLNDPLSHQVRTRLEALLEMIR
jgi:benzoyl-CoA reductase/2-hydroxyglutaryl-CoA dehydratase subunit BcrC/BadD/HgdB